MTNQQTFPFDQFERDFLSQFEAGRDGSKLMARFKDRFDDPWRQADALLLHFLRRWLAEHDMTAWWSTDLVSSTRLFVLAGASIVTSASAAAFSSTARETAAGPTPGRPAALDRRAAR